MVTRLSPPGKAISLRIPLLRGENVLSSNVVTKDGFMEVRLGAFDQSFSWESELPVTEKIELSTRQDDTWIERWSLVASPVWNVALEGLPPLFEQSQAELVPTWQPWPGESVALLISRPEAVSGATITAHKIRHETNLGRRQRSSELDIELQCSLGEDFALELPAQAEITRLTLNGSVLPVRKDGDKLMLSLRPGSQTVSVQWKNPTELGVLTRADSVKLPVETSNIRSTLRVPEDRWVLWTQGPQQGPAVRFWPVLALALLVAWVLTRIPGSPLATSAWFLLLIGLTQVNLTASLAIVAWLFLLAWRGRESFQKLPAWAYNLLQIVVILFTLASLGIFVSVAAAGLLGRPEMFILGNGSSSALLQWYQARAGEMLPQPALISVSIWWYRLLMLAWALWLAMSLLRWLKWGWTQFSTGSMFRPWHQSTPPAVPPPLHS
ncbi:MAG: hypothetical protein HC904_03930 [Blastochloris sp.]|nr:hypothetical protein [Blastochloris sp.]